MAQQYRCDMPGCDAPARWMETDMDTGQVHTYCDVHHHRDEEDTRLAGNDPCDMDDCYEVATVVVKNLQTGEAERFCHLHYIDFIMGLALKIGEESGLLPPDGPIPEGEQQPGGEPAGGQPPAAGARKSKSKRKGPQGGGQAAADPPGGTEGADQAQPEAAPHGAAQSDTPSA